MSKVVLPKTMQPSDAADVLVFGSGAAGLTAALVAAVQGLDVRLYEATTLFGGTTATSGGTLWVPGAEQVLNATPDASADLARRYLSNELGSSAHMELLDAFFESGPEAIAFLQRHTHVQFQYAQNPDYHADAPHGSPTGHAITAVPFDGAKLGESFRMLRAPRDVFMVLGGMMVGRREIPALVRPWRSAQAAKNAVSLISRHMLHRLRHERGARLLIGNALVARYLMSLQERKVPMFTGMRLLELKKEGGCVIGAVVECGGKPRLILARRGIVLATGGMAHDWQSLRQLRPDYPHSCSMAIESSRGEGIRAATQVGAVIDANVDSPAYWSPMSVRRRPGRDPTTWIHGHMDRGKPGVIAVNRRGFRFVNEADSYHDFVLAMFEEREQFDNVPAYLICDHRFIKKYGLGLVRPLISRLSPFLRDGYLLKGRTIRELAVRAGIDPDGLDRTVQRYNAAARIGEDPEFGRGTHALNRFNGDPDHHPNPCVAPIEKGPFYAVEVWPASIGTTLGLKTDRDARVLDQSGSVIRGLYACGNDMSPVMRGYYPGPGATLGPAVVFGYRAACSLSAPAESAAGQDCATPGHTQ